MKRIKKCDYYVIYLTTNIINNKKYVGLHGFNQNEKIYFGSGKYLKNAIKKYGKEKFQIEILEKCENLEKAIEKEIFWIKEKNAKFPTGYNLTDGGEGGLQRIVSEETRKKISNWHKGKIKGELNPNFGDKLLTKEQKEKRNKLLSEIVKSEKSRDHLRKLKTGKKLSPEHIEKLKKADRSKWKISSEGMLRIKEANSKPKSEETKKKLSQARMGKEPWNKGKGKLKEIKIKQPRYGENNSNSKLSKNQVKEIRQLLSENKKVKDISFIYGVSFKAIYNIRNNKSWSL